MGKYAVKKTSTGFNFQLIAGNGEPIGTSEVYKAKASALKGIESIRRNAPIAGIEDQTLEESIKSPAFEIFLDKKGEFRFRLRAANGEPILASEPYSSKAAAKNGIESVRKNADSEVVELEPAKA